VVIGSSRYRGAVLLPRPSAGIYPRRHAPSVLTAAGGHLHFLACPGAAPAVSPELRRLLRAPRETRKRNRRGTPVAGPVERSGGDGRGSGGAAPPGPVSRAPGLARCVFRGFPVPGLSQRGGVLAAAELVPPFLNARVIPGCVVLGFSGATGRPASAGRPGRPRRGAPHRCRRVRDQHVPGDGR